MILEENFHLIIVEFEPATSGQKSVRKCDSSQLTSCLKYHLNLDGGMQLFIYENSPIITEPEINNCFKYVSYFKTIDKTTGGHIEKTRVRSLLCHNHLRGNQSE